MPRLCLIDIPSHIAALSPLVESELGSVNKHFPLFRHPHKSIWELDELLRSQDVKVLLQMSQARVTERDGETCIKQDKIENGFHKRSRLQDTLVPSDPRGGHYVDSPTNLNLI